MKHLSLAAFAAAFVLATPMLAATNHITDPYARIIAGAGAVYFAIDNRSDQDDRLIAATSEIGMAMLMTSGEDADGLMHMTLVPEGFAVPAGTRRVLAPAGDHVMLSSVSGTFKKGDTITVVLTFQTAGQITVTAPVDITRRTPPGPGPTRFDAVAGK